MYSRKWTLYCPTRTSTPLRSRPEILLNCACTLFFLSANFCRLPVIIRLLGSHFASVIILLFPLLPVPLLISFAQREGSTFSPSSHCNSSIAVSRFGAAEDAFLVCTLFSRQLLCFDDFFSPNGVFCGSRQRPTKYIQRRLYPRSFVPAFFGPFTEQALSLFRSSLTIPATSSGCAVPFRLIDRCGIVSLTIALLCALPSSFLARLRVSDLAFPTLHCQIAPPLHHNLTFERGTFSLFSPPPSDDCVSLLASALIPHQFLVLSVPSEKSKSRSFPSSFFWPV